MVTLDATLFWDFVTKFGLPLTLVLVFIVTGKRGDWVWGREVKREQEATAREKEIAAEMRASRDKWEGVAWETLQTVNVAVTKVPVKEQPPP